MAQLIVFGLFIMALIAGAYSYLAPSHPKAMNPWAFLMDKSGYTEMQTQNRKKTQEVNLTTSAGVMQIRKQMDDLAIVQNNFMDSIQDQQQILKGANKDATDVLLAAKKAGGEGNKDILQLEALTSQIQNEQNLSIAHGQDLVTMNNQITENRQWISDQIDYANIYTNTELLLLQKRNRLLKAQTAEFFDNMYGYRQEMHDAMVRMHEKLEALANAAYEDKAIEEMIKGRARQMLEKEHEDMLKLNENEEKNRDRIRDLQQKLADAQERLEDMEQQAKDQAEDQRQKQDDEKMMIQQRMDDQRQRIQDQQNR